MKVRLFIRKLLPPFILDAIKKKVNFCALYLYKILKRKPWTRGYGLYKADFIAKTLKNNYLMSIFSNNDKLPEEYGVGIDERCVELPWSVSHLLAGEEKVFDAGSSFNHSFVLNQEIFKEKEVSIMTLAPENDNFLEKRISYFYGDLRKVPIVDNYFDKILCVSTLEHIGFNNINYSKVEKFREFKKDDYLKTVRELVRVLKIGGSLFVTVPYGKYTDFGWFQQFDQDKLSTMLNIFDKIGVSRVVFYKYLNSGWKLSDRIECSECVYVKNDYNIESDGAVAARAVACIHFVKNK